MYTKGYYLVLISLLSQSDLWLAVIIIKQEIAYFHMISSYTGRSVQMVQVRSNHFHQMQGQGWYRIELEFGGLVHMLLNTLLDFAKPSNFR